MKLRVLWPGKTKAPHYRVAIDDYASRIGRLIRLEIVETREESRTDKQRLARVRKESASLAAQRRAPVSVFLDSSGKQFSSEEFARWLERTSSDIDFIIGGPQGTLAPENAVKLSFGKMTLPHELARVVLLEQIYRALTILKKIPYHK